MLLYVFVLPFVAILLSLFLVQKSNVTEKIMNFFQSRGQGALVTLGLFGATSFIGTLYRLSQYNAVMIDDQLISLPIDYLLSGCAIVSVVLLSAYFQAKPTTKWNTYAFLQLVGGISLLLWDRFVILLAPIYIFVLSGFAVREKTFRAFLRTGVGYTAILYSTLFLMLESWPSGKKGTIVTDISQQWSHLFGQDERAFMLIYPVLASSVVALLISAIWLKTKSRGVSIAALMVSGAVAVGLFLPLGFRYVDLLSF